MGKAYIKCITVLLGISLCICLFPFFAGAADVVTEEIPVTWRRIDAVSQLIDYCSQNIYYYRQGGDPQEPIDSTFASTVSYNRYYGLLTERISPIINPKAEDLTLTSKYWGNKREIYPYFEYITDYVNFNYYDNYNFTNSNYPLSSSPIYYVGTGQRNFATWKQKIELNSDYPVSDYYAGNYKYSFPSLVALRLFADVNIDKLTEYDYINFTYDYTTFYPDGDNAFNSKVKKLFDDSRRYAASIGYVENGYYVPLVFADSQFSSFARYNVGVHNDNAGDGVTTTQTIDFNLPNIVFAYNERFNLSLTVDEFKQSFPNLTVACSFWHVVFDYVNNGAPVASLQYFGRYSLPVVYLSNYNPVTVAISQVNQRLDDISNSLFIVQDSGDVQIIDKLANNIEGSTGIVSGFDSAAAVVDSLIGSVKPETSVMVNAFGTGGSVTGAGDIFANNVDVKRFLSNEFIMPMMLIAITVSVISWVIYGKRSG